MMLPELEKQWKAKIQKLKDELLQLQKERDNLIADMKIGARCSQCNKWKSEFEKEGVDFQKHLGEVKGYAVPATTSELEEVRKRYSEKMAIIKVQIQKLEKSDNEYTKMLAMIKNLEDGNVKLCNEITKHSEYYEKKVTEDGKKYHEEWANNLMSYVCQMLIHQDKISIYNEQQILLAKKFSEESEKVKLQVKEAIEKERLGLLGKIVLNNQFMSDLENTKEIFLTKINEEINVKKRQKSDVESELLKSGITDDTQSELKKKIENLAAEISEKETERNNYISEAEAKIENMRQQNFQFNNEILQLPIKMNKVQDEEIAKVKSVFDKEISDAKYKQEQAVTDLEKSRKEYNEKVKEYKAKNNILVEMVNSEVGRIVISSQKVSCAYRNDSYSIINMNWSNVFSCVSSVAKSAKPYSMNVFNPYCSERLKKSTIDAYKSFLSTLNENEFEIVRANSNHFWFQSLIKK
ncbi:MULTISPECIES: hypothetical protein [Chryseobacterium]|uniref:hypothetical protein n=1 Tax=Chryseobacterium TaxID=59732 RepID=UPI001297D5C8|nr:MULTISPECIES: hypothetical protein [Chryseobacterium]MDR6921880.1 hypothetical protein [Chryseobacterium sp. 2987]